MAISGTIRNPKNIALASRLGIDPGVSLGLLEAMWDFTREYARAGDIGRFKDGAIVGGMMIPLLMAQSKLTPSQLIEAMVEEGWLDRREDCRLFVHDWADWCDETTRKKLERAHITHFADGSPVRRQKRDENGGEQQPNGGHRPPKAPRDGSRTAAERLPSGENTPPKAGGSGSQLAADQPPNGENEGEKQGSVAAFTRAGPEPVPEPDPETGGRNLHPEVPPSEGTGGESGGMASGSPPDSPSASGFDRGRLMAEMNRLAGRGLPPATESDADAEERRKRILGQARGMNARA